MAEYIDRNKIEWKSFPYDSGEWYPDYAEKRDIDKIPTADVVEVVRCKDCKWWKNGELCRNVNGLNSIVWNGEWFCASGQRKEGAEE